MPSEVRQNKMMEKLNRAQKCSILGPQNLGLREPRLPGPLDLHLLFQGQFVSGIQTTFHNKLNFSIIASHMINYYWSFGTLLF